MKNALKKCLQEKGYVDIKYICEMTDRRWDAVIEELGNEIYLNPEKMDLMDITVTMVFHDKENDISDYLNSLYN